MMIYNIAMVEKYGKSVISEDLNQSSFIKLLVEQIDNEFTSSMQYVAIGAYYDSQDLPQLAKLFYDQSVEERRHALIIIRYLLDRGEKVMIGGIGEIINRFNSVTEPIELALKQEKIVTDQIVALAKSARTEGDYLGEQFLQWFLQEQVEEVAKMTTLLGVASRPDTSLLELESFIARDMRSDPEGAISTPKAAGE